MFYKWTHDRLGWELGGPGVLGVGTGDRGPWLGDVLQMDKRPFRLGTGGHWGFRGGDRGVGTHMIPVRGSLPPPPPHGMGPKTCVLQHSAWKRCICSVFCMVGCWCGPRPCKFLGFLQPTFRKRVICNVSASTSWSSAAAPSSISVSNYHIILNLLLRVFSLGTGLISVYILCLSNFLLECLVFRNWSNLKFS